MSENLRTTILETVEDLARDFVYYDRKDDEGLPLGSVEESIRSGVISLDEVCAHFRKSMQEAIAGTL